MPVIAQRKCERMEKITQPQLVVPSRGLAFLDSFVMVTCNAGRCPHGLWGTYLQAHVQRNVAELMRLMDVGTALKTAALLHILRDHTHAAARTLDEDTAPVKDARSARLLAQDLDQLLYLRQPGM